MASVSQWAIGLAALTVIGIGATLALRPLHDDVETIGFTQPLKASDAAMLPWRDSKHDMAAFFPGSDSYRQRTLILSGLRVPISKRLGPGESLDANALYAYTVTQRGKSRGTILVSRVAGEYGAIEFVLGVNETGRVAGARVQRQRETPAIADALTSPAWLGAWRSKSAADDWKLGGDVPDVPAPARTTAQKLLRAARALLTAFDVAEHKM